MTSQNSNGQRSIFAVHEAGHAAVGNLLYGPTFVTKVKIRLKSGGTSYGVTSTNLKDMINRPQQIWDGSSVVPVNSQMADVELCAAATQAMAGMAAEQLVLQDFSEAKDDVILLNMILHQVGKPPIDTTASDLKGAILAHPVAAKGLMDAKALLAFVRPEYEVIKDWLEHKTKTLQGHEIDSLMAGESIRDGDRE